MSVGISFQLRYSNSAVQVTARVLEKEFMMQDDPATRDPPKRSITGLLASVAAAPFLALAGFSALAVKSLALLFFGRPVERLSNASSKALKGHLAAVNSKPSLSDDVKQQVDSLNVSSAIETNHVSPGAARNRTPIGRHR